MARIRAARYRGQHDATGAPATGEQAKRREASDLRVPYPLHQGGAPHLRRTRRPESARGCVVSGLRPGDCRTMGRSSVTRLSWRAPDGSADTRTDTTAARHATGRHASWRTTKDTRPATFRRTGCWEGKCRSGQAAVAGFSSTDQRSPLRDLAPIPSCIGGADDATDRVPSLTQPDILACNLTVCSAT